MKAICIKEYRCKITKEWVKVNTKLDLDNERFIELSNKGFVKGVKKRKRKKDVSTNRK